MASIAQRIRKIRLLRKITQRELGLALGFTDRTSDIRIAQYENGSRTPKEHYIEGLAYVLGVSTTALTAPDVRDDYDMMHVLFELEDKYGFRINEINGTLCITVDPFAAPISFSMLHHRLSSWRREYLRLQNGEITQEEYDLWRYEYPKETEFTTMWL